MFDIWVIDDQVEMCQEVIEYWQRITSDYPFRFRLFPTAGKALATLVDLRTQGEGRPRVILVDGHLRQDKGELSQGVAVVREIIEMCPRDVPHLIAWSADPFANEEMKSAGASIGFEKTHPKRVALHLQRKYEEIRD